jgi:hypothetical protein
MDITLTPDHVAALKVAIGNHLQLADDGWAPDGKRTFALLGDVLDMLNGVDLPDLTA